MKNENWTLNIQFHPFILKNPALKDEIESFYIDCCLVTQRDLEREKDEGYDIGYEEGKFENQKVIMKDLKEINSMEELESYINDNS